MVEVFCDRSSFTSFLFPSRLSFRFLFALYRVVFLLFLFLSIWFHFALFIVVFCFVWFRSDRVVAWHWIFRDFILFFKIIFVLRETGSQFSENLA